MASERYIMSATSKIANDSGRMVSDHGEKTALLFLEFKKRLDSSVGISMQFDLQSLVPSHHESLSQLNMPFSTEEIDDVIPDLPADKALSPNGFNCVFFKKAWPIIKQDFYKFCMDSYDHQVDLKCINYSYIILVPKNDNPETVNDFRPISLMDSSPKIVAKLLANRIKKVDLQVIHEN
jgi:hypothetical protein